MRVSLDWLREWVETGSDVQALAHALTMAGLEIEGVERAGPELKGVIVGEVRSVTKHPDAEKLNVCSVFNGTEEVQIVCGAPNVRAGMKAPLATIGAVLPNGTQIKKAKLRGVESFGMLCSARELDLTEDSNGLFDLPADFVAGTDLNQALSLDDTVFEVNLTPNRGDCMSVLGIAREVAAARRVELQPAQVQPVQADIADTFPVTIEAPQGCPKFVGRVIRGINGKAKSPFWMQERLRRAGLRPISAVVDVTNYVMLELGQPMHAYDLSRLEGSIVVRFAKEGEKLQLLDGRTVDLSSDVLVIADSNKPLGIAGVMGGEESGISDATTDVFLEVAYFDPDTIAGRGRRYGLVTDASQRFERGVDPQLQERAIERATALLIECSGGKAGPSIVTGSATPARNIAPIRVRHARIGKVLGAEIAPDIAADLMRRLGMSLQSSALSPQPAEWLVSPPSWRFDIRIEEDLIEEVARLYGFDNIPETSAQIVQELAPWPERRVRNERAADLLVDRGYQEAITYTFTDPAWQGILHPESALALVNPISAELAVMRLSLWPGLLQAVRENQRRQQQRVRLFEIGRRFAPETGAETEVVAGVAVGAATAEQWGVETRSVDFYDVKADVEALLALTGDGGGFRFVKAAHPALHPGQCAQIVRGDRVVGWLGALHPEHTARMDLTYPVFVFEIETEAALAADLPEYREISKYPAIRRDIAVIVDEATPVDALLDTVRASEGGLLKGVSVLSVYQGRQIEKGKKSIALGLQLQDTSRTLTDQEADAFVARVVEQLASRHGAVIRDK
jgi:phenylalanyl-tRNA synthetase beta chain